MSRYSLTQDVNHRNFADYRQSVSHSHDFSQLKFRRQGLEQAPEALSLQDIDQVLDEILARKILIVFPPYDPRTRKKEDLFDPERDAHVFDYASALIQRGGKSPAVFFEVLCFFDSCARARCLMRTHSGNIQLIFERFLEERGYKKHLFFSFDRGMIWERDSKNNKIIDPRDLPEDKLGFCFSNPIPAAIDSEPENNTDTDSQATISPDPSEGESMSKSSSNEALSDKGKEELFQGVDNNKDLDQARELAEREARELAETQAREFAEKKEKIISALESFDMDREDELCVIGITKALEKAEEKFKDFSGERKRSREGKSLEKWIEQLKKRKRFLENTPPPSLKDPLFQIYHQHAKKEWQFREVVQSYQYQLLGGISCIRLAIAETELQSVLRVMHDKLFETHRQKNSSEPSQVSRLLERFVASRSQDFSLFGWKPLPTSPEKKQVPVAKNAERPNDLPVIFAVCKVVLQFLLDLLTAFVEAQAKSGSLYTFVR